MGDAAPPAPFIIGAPRSGMTLLCRMLDAHPQLAIAPETSFPRGFFREAAGVRTDMPGLMALLGGMQSIASLGLAPDALEQILPPAPFLAGDALRRIYRAYAMRFHKPRWGDPTRDYSIAMRAIKRVLPEACFIHLIRDGRDSLVSEREAMRSVFGDRERGAARHAIHWDRYVSKGRKQGAGTGAYLEVRFERLVQEPEAVLREICAFLELDFDLRMLRYHETAGSPPDPARAARWRDALSREEAVAFEQIAGETLDALGYARHGEARPVAAPGVPTEAPMGSAASRAKKAFQRGGRLKKAGDFEGALVHFRKAAALAPDEIQYLNRYAQDLEQAGHFEEAWDLFARLARRLSAPLPNEWTGGPVAGKHVVLRRRMRHIAGEIRQARFIAPLARDAASCTVVAEPRLAALLARSFPQVRVVAEGAGEPAGDCNMGYEDAASLYGRTEQAVRDAFAPLVPDPALVRAFQEKYRQPGKRLVGIAWTSTNERKRLPALADWRPLLARGDCRFVSLQYGDVAADAAALNAISASPIVVDAEVDQLADMDRFAAQVSAVDAVITISCTGAHLAGALARPTIVLFDELDEPKAWQRDRETSPWYPTLRLFFKRGAQPWTDVIDAAARASAG